MSASSMNRRPEEMDRRHESGRSPEHEFAAGGSVRAGGAARRSRRRRKRQDHARRRAAPATRRRDRARRAGAGRAARRDRHRAALSTCRARRCARRCGSWRRAAWSRRARIAAPWWRGRRSERLNGDVRGDGRARGAVRGPCRRAHAGGGARAARGDPRGIAGVELCRQSRALSRSQRALSQRDLCRLAERLYRRDDAGDAGARAAVPPRPVPQSRPARQIARRARPRRGRDHARRQDRRCAAMRAHIELVRGEYEIYAVSV